MTSGADEASRRVPGRLRRRPEFLAAAEGRRFHTERLSVQARLRAEPETREGCVVDGLQVGFTLTKRVGHATERNRIRRRLRRAIACAAADALALPVDLVVIGRRPALSASFETLVDDLRRALRAASKPRSGAPGEGRREGAHVTRRGGSRRAAPDTAPIPNTTTPHGTTDG